MSYLSQFHYEILGTNATKPRLVFLHGLMGFGSNWKTIARRFSDDHQILLYDQRGHGRSMHASSYQLEDYAQDLKTILQELGWSKIILIGHSFGGRVALQFAATHPEMLEKLVIVDISPLSDMASMYAIEEKIRFVPVPFANRDQARDFFDGPFLNLYKSELLKQFFYANLAVNAQGAMNWRFDREGILDTMRQLRRKDQWDQLKNLTLPTLVLRGENSTDLTDETFQRMKNCNSHVQGGLVKGAGHWVHVEKPGETIQLLEGFLQDGKVGAP